MKKLFIGLIMLSTSASFACDFQAEQDELVKARDIKCNEIERVATVVGPKVKIDDSFYNIGGVHSVEKEYWERETRGWDFLNLKKTETTLKKKTRYEGRWLSGRSQDEICTLFGFSSSVGMETANIFSWFKKAYHFDYGELYRQAINYAPISKIKCR